MFPMYDMNPSAPKSAGEPGLMYGSRLDLAKDSPYSMFTSDPTSKRAVWTYVGEYECTTCGTMDAGLFKSQRQQVIIPFRVEFMYMFADRLHRSRTPGGS